MFFQEKQQITIFIVAGAIIGGFVLFRYLPLQKRIKTVRQIRAVQTKAINQGSADSKQLPVFEEKLQKLQKMVGNYETNIPAQRALGDFLQRITNLMNKYSLKEQVIAPGAEIEADELHCIPVEMRCKGRLTQLFEFYKGLRGSDRLIRIEHVKLENDDSYSGEVSMETKAIIYYRAKAG